MGSLPPPPSPPPKRRPALWMARGVRFRLSTTTPVNKVEDQVLPTRDALRLYSPLPSPQLPDPGRNNYFHSPRPRPQRRVPAGPQTPAGRRVLPLTPAPESRLTAGPGWGEAVCGPRPLCGPDCGPPRRCGPRRPLSRSPPHNSGTQNPTAARPPRCARQLAPDPRGRRGAGARGGNRSDPAAQVRARRPGHSLDEVAGSLLREALLPAAGQVCGNAKKVGSNLSRPSAAPQPRRPGSHLSGSCGRS